MVCVQRRRRAVRVVRVCIRAAGRVRPDMRVRGGIPREIAGRAARGNRRRALCGGDEQRRRRVGTVWRGAVARRGSSQNRAGGSCRGF